MPPPDTDALPIPPTSVDLEAAHCGPHGLLQQFDRQPLAGRAEAVGLAYGMVEADQGVEVDEAAALGLGDLDVLDRKSVV